MDMKTSKLTAEGIIGEAVRIGARMSGGEFPIEIFPIKIQRIISSLHDCQGYPVDYVAAAILAAIAVGIGNSHLVQVKRNWLPDECSAHPSGRLHHGRSDGCHYVYLRYLPGFRRQPVGS